MVCQLVLIGDRVIGRRLLLYAIVSVLAITFIQPPPAKVPQAHAEQPQNINKSKSQAVKPAEKPKDEPKPELIVAPAEKTTPAPEPVAAKTAVQETQQTPATPQAATSCADAIAKVWPAELQAGARLVAQKESSLIATRVGAVNQDGSQDFGCFQINNQAHSQFFANGDWRDPVYNAQYALRIYQGRGNWTAWYAVRGILW